MDKSLIVFTNFDSLCIVDPNCVDYNEINLIKDNKFLGFDETSLEFKKVDTITSAYSLYFVLDSISFQDFIQLIGDTNKANIFILRHKLPNFNFEGIPTSNIEKGQHETTGPFYNKVLKIITDANTDKLSLLLKAIFTHDHILEAKLALLYNILNGNQGLSEVIGVITDDKTEKAKRIFDQIFKTDETPDIMPNLEKRVLESKEILKEKVVSLEEKLIALKSDFEKLANFDDNNIFSVEYQLAFEKLRDTLNIG